MTVHTSGTLGITATDFQTVHKGILLAVKLLNWDSGVPVISILEKKAEGWASTYILYEFDDLNTSEKVTLAAGGTVNWIKTVLVPLVNTALLKRFPKVTTTTTVVTGSLEDIDINLGKVMAWSPQADGTLKVAVK